MSFKPIKKLKFPWIKSKSLWFERGKKSYQDCDIDLYRSVICKQTTLTLEPCKRQHENSAEKVPFVGQILQDRYGAQNVEMETT